MSLDDGFWRKRYETVAGSSVYAIMDSFKKTGRFAAFRQDWVEGQPNKPHIFWDSDVAKWIEAVAYILNKREDPVLEAEVDKIIDLIEKHQDDNGYFNIYFTLIEPAARWQRRGAHELYTAGHRIEAAVAYFEATGKDKFLKLMCKFADHIEKVFKIDRSAAFTSPGHEEIELALVRLYRCTGERRYLELSKHFIDVRGTEPASESYPWKKSRVIQDHAPVREQTTAEGHAVRAAYLYSGMADIAFEYDDRLLFEACRAIFENMTQKRMYITGGTGSSVVSESFTVDYDLPNLTAYTETCSAIASAFFMERMTMCDNSDASYADTFEKIMYNGLMSGISLDGRTFFYENPLEIQPYLVERNEKVFSETDLNRVRLPKPQRSEVFSCSCCPPNIARFIASVGGKLFTYNDDTLFVNQYMAASAKTSINGCDVALAIKTTYPADGHMHLSVTGGRFKKIAVRIPSWCREYSIKSRGRTIVPEIIKGYAYIDYPDDTIAAASHVTSPAIELEMDFKMQVRLIESSPYVQDNAGKVAVQYGPIIYCLEEPDNGNLLKDIRISSQSSWKVEYSSYFGADILKTSGYTRKIPAEGSLYYEPSDNGNLAERPLTFIPYYGFANRGIAEMVVWVLKC